MRLEKVVVAPGRAGKIQARPGNHFPLKLVDLLVDLFALLAIPEILRTQLSGCGQQVKRVRRVPGLDQRWDDRASHRVW